MNAVAGAPVARGRALRIGMVCPYSLAVPGGVQTHVLALAAALRAAGHRVDVLAPGAEHESVTSTGRAFAVPYNGSVARLAFGPLAYARVRRWLAGHRFDVLHVHEPLAPSLSMLALLLAGGPIVATFHAATPRSRVLLAAQPMVRPLLEKLTGRIAVSAAARRVQVEHLGLDAVQIGNGVDLSLLAGERTADGQVADGRTAERRAGGGATVGFAGRFGEPRKGFGVLLSALRRMRADPPRLVVAGAGDVARARAAAGRALAPRIEFLGAVDEHAKARMLRSVDVLCAPQLGGESFGMVLTEAMAAGAPVLASDLAAFRAVTAGAAELVPPGDPAALGAALRGLLDDPARRSVLREAGRARAARYDWPVIAAAVTRVYRAAIAATPGAGVTGAARPSTGAS